MLSTMIIIVIAAALVFEFINGFHDTANAIATSVYTRALTPTKAIILAASMNMLGALVSEKVAMTITHGLVTVQLEEYVVLAALLGAIIWNLVTWWKGIPSSSSHALIGSLIGATIAHTATLGDVLWGGVLQKVILPLFTSPFVGFLVGFSAMKLIYNIFQNSSPAKVNGLFSKLQIGSAAFIAFTHGTNDAQKTMGIITLALITAGQLPSDTGVPLWVKVTCAIAIAAGTSAGGRRIMKTMGGGMTKLQPPGGFAAQTSSAIVIEGMSLLGAPISTTHVITSAVMGVGSAKRFSAVKWGTAKDILITWVLTLPATAAVGAVCVLIFDAFM
ncbi:MAG: inorganic phosphate transporter [Clostridiales Family XIII bacterium]|jgi:PiT family inorganic phosphate transporter|nr:inorganic phosphate transporter [Clostridiales Family XIII bacterium]